MHPADAVARGNAVVPWGLQRRGRDCTGTTVVTGVDRVCPPIAAVAGLAAVTCDAAPIVLLWQPLDALAPGIATFKEAVALVEPGLADLVAVVEHIDQLNAPSVLAPCDAAIDTLAADLATLEQTRADAVQTLTIFGA